MKLADLLNRRQYSLRWFKKQNEIVKYKPEGYNERGVYTLDEWTDYSCVGHFFSRKKLKMEEYERVENNYINCVMDIVRCVGIKYLSISFYGNDDSITVNGKTYKEGSRIKSEDIIPVLRGNLRGEMDCVLVNVRRGIQIDFGYDYYMHVVCPIPHDELAKIVSANHLYLNPRVVRPFWKLYDEKNYFLIRYIPRQQ